MRRFSTFFCIFISCLPTSLSSLLPCDCSVVLDLSILIDASGSLKPTEFDRAKIFVNLLLKRLKIVEGKRQVYVGVSAFDDKPRGSFQLLVSSEYLKEVVVSRVKSLPFTGRSTALIDVLMHAREQFFKVRKDSTAPRLIVLFSDGGANKAAERVLEEMEKVKAEGIELFIVETGGNVSGLAEAASLRSYSCVLEELEPIVDAINQLTQDACGFDVFW
jgi:Mg-chelatase subunit ChlD